MWSPMRLSRPIGRLNWLVTRGYVVRRIVMVPMRLSRRHSDADGGHDHVDDEQRHERIDDGFVDRVADGLCAAAGDRQPAIAGHRPAINPNSMAFTHEMITSGTPVNSVMPAANAPGFTAWMNTEKK